MTKKRAAVKKSLFVFLIIAALAIGLSGILRIFLADVAYAEGRKLNRREQFAEATPYLTRAANLNPYEPAYRRDLADALVMQLPPLDFDPEAESFAEFIAPHKGRIDEAFEQARAAFRLNPYNSLTLRSLVRTYFELSFYSGDALVLAEEVALFLTTLSPSEPYTHYSAAVILSQTGKREETLKALERALKLNPNLPEALRAKELLEAFPSKEGAEEN